MKRMLDYLFGKSRRCYCSFCGKHHSKVAKLIEGHDGYICNNCVKICTDVLMKECAEYRESFRAMCGNTESSATPNGGTAMPRGDSEATQGPL